ncbi:glycerol-3-phosphate transporter [Klebsiella michiganensis]|nr:glycerol-3-phosphate transporter [Klebsiella michiganensis]
MPTAEIDPLYRRLRWQIFIGIFFGYAAYYLVRKNFALAMPYLIEQGFSRGDLGFALSGISIAYGFRNSSWARFLTVRSAHFLPAGLILAALVMLVMGFVPWATSHYGDVRPAVPVRLVPGKGWPPCGRTMVHWWSQKERGGYCFGMELRAHVGGGIPPLLFSAGDGVV